MPGSRIAHALVAGLGRRARLDLGDPPAGESRRARPFAQPSGQQRRLGKQRVHMFRLRPLPLADLSMAADIRMPGFTDATEWL